MNELTLKNRLINLIHDMTEDQLRNLLNLIENQQSGYRKHHREDCSIVTDYIVRDKTYKDFIKNISAGGVYIKTQQPQVLGQDIFINFTLPDYHEPIRVYGKIVRIDSEGFAVQSLINLQMILENIK